MLFTESVDPNVGVCRICRGEGSSKNPLYHPCKCKGSIKFIHESCLLEWMNSKGVDINKPGAYSKCDICHYPIQFKTLYDEDMPERIPFKLLVKQSLFKMYQFSTYLLITGAAAILFVIGLPLMWNIWGKFFTICLDEFALPLSKEYPVWMSFIYGFEKHVPSVPTLQELILQILNNFIFSILQVFILLVLHLAIYFQYDMVIREDIFNKMIYDLIGPKFTRKEFIKKNLSERFPGLDQNTLDMMADLMILKESGVKVPPQPPVEQIRHDEDPDVVPNDHSSNDGAVSDNDSIIDQGNLNELGGDHDVNPIEDVVQQQADMNRDVNHLDQFIENDIRRPNIPLVVPPLEEFNEQQIRNIRGNFQINQPQQQDADVPIFLQIHLKLHMIPVYFIVGSTIIFFYLLLSYFIPSIIGFCLLRIYSSIFGIVLRGLFTVSNSLKLPVLYNKLFKWYPFVATSNSSIVLDIVSVVLRYYNGYCNGTMKDSMLIRGLPVLVTYATFILLICILPLFVARGFGPKNGMKNENRRFSFQLLFAIKCTMKVFLLFTIELAGFPVLAGVMLDMSLISPVLFKNEWLFVTKFCEFWPPASLIVYWGVGTLYMYWFAKYIGMIRQYIIRPGVLFFIRSPDDPNIRILHDSLIHPLRVQLSRLFLSMLIYGMFIIIGFGFHTRLLYPILMKSSLLPISHSLYKPVEGFYHLSLGALGVTKVILENQQNIKIYVRQYWSRVFEVCCKKLRLSSFILGKDIQSERGYIIYRNIYYEFVRPNKARRSNPNLFIAPKTLMEAKKLFKENNSLHAYFIPDGNLMRAPANDIISRNYVQLLFVPVTKDDKLLKPLDLERIRERNLKNVGRFSYLDNQNTDFDAYTVVYAPPAFRIRYSLLIIMIWIFASFLFIALTLASNFVGKVAFTIFLFPFMWLLKFNYALNNAFFKSLNLFSICFGLILLAFGLDFYHNTLQSRIHLNNHIVPIHELINEQEEMVQNLRQPVAEVNIARNGLQIRAAFNAIRNSLIGTVLIHNFTTAVALNINFLTHLFHYFFCISLFKEYYCFGNHIPKLMRNKNISVSMLLNPLLNTKFGYHFGIPSERISLICMVFECSLVMAKIGFESKIALNGRVQTIWTYLYRYIFTKFMSTVVASFLLQVLCTLLEYITNKESYSAAWAPYIFLVSVRPNLTHAHYQWTVFQKMFYFIDPIICLIFYAYLTITILKDIIPVVSQRIKDDMYAKGRTLENLEGPTNE